MKEVCEFLTKRRCGDESYSFCEVLGRQVDDGCDYCFEKERIKKQEDERDAGPLLEETDDNGEV